MVRMKGSKVKTKQPKIPAYKYRKYSKNQRGSKMAKKAVMKRAGVLRKYMEPSSAMSRAWKDITRPGIKRR